MGSSGCGEISRARIPPLERRDDDAAWFREMWSMASGEKKREELLMQFLPSRFTPVPSLQIEAWALGL